MVRIKHRYLLVDILHPEPSQRSSSSSLSTTSTVPAHLYFHPPTPDALTSSVLARLLRDAVSELFGDYGAGKLGGASTGNLIVKYLSPATSTAIIRCPRAAYRMVWAALTYLNAIPAPPASKTGTKLEKSMRNVVFRVVRVSGTIRKAEEEAIRRARSEIGRTMRSGSHNAGVLDELFGAKVKGDTDEDVFVGREVQLPDADDESATGSDEDDSASDD